MSIFKRGETWYIHIETQHHKIRRSAKTTSRKKALELHDKIRAELWDQERLGVKPKYKFEDAALRWLDEKENKKSIAGDVAKIEFFNAHLAGQYLDDITRDQISALLLPLKTQATRNRYVALLRAMYRRARDVWEWIERVPAFQTYTEANKRMQYLTPDQVNLLLNALPKPHRPVVILAVSTGLRRSNIYGMKWDQVDLVKRMAWIHADQAKSGRAIPVPLNDDAFSAIKTQLGLDPVSVFPISPINWKTWQAALVRAGLSPAIRFHDLRHTFASWHAMAGTPMHAIQELGGWRSPAMLQRYAHLSQDHLTEQAKNISLNKSEAKLKAVA